MSCVEVLHFDDHGPTCHSEPVLGREGIRPTHSKLQLLFEHIHVVLQTILVFSDKSFLIFGK